MARDQRTIVEHYLTKKLKIMVHDQRTITVYYFDLKNLNKIMAHDQRTIVEHFLTKELRVNINMVLD